jgi:hypothetical protein
MHELLYSEATIPAQMEAMEFLMEVGWLDESGKNYFGMG